MKKKILSEVKVGRGHVKRYNYANLYERIN